MATIRPDTAVAAEMDGGGGLAASEFWFGIILSPNYEFSVEREFCVRFRIYDNLTNYLYLLNDPWVIL